MLRIDIKKFDGSIGWSAQWPDQNSANSWIAREEANGSWGVPASAGAPASYTGAPVDQAEPVTITAVSVGTQGNVILYGDGASSLATIISNWNSANPTNQVSLTSGNGAQIPSLSMSMALSNGRNPVLGYTISQTDVTAQYNNQLAVQTALNNQNVGAIIVANVAAQNEALLASGAMTQTQFNALLADQTVLNIERLLWNGSLVTAKALINANIADLQNYYTSDQINQILALFP